MKVTTYATTKDELMLIPAPETTRTYKSVGHSQLIDITLESIHKAGFELAKETYTSARDGNIANGRYAIRNVADNEMQLQVGWQNSLNKSISLKFATGTRIMICENGCVSGDYGWFKKKHQGDVQEFTPYTISEYIKSAGDSFLTMQKEREEMKQIEVSRRICAELLGRLAIEEEILESTQLSIVKRELDAPTFDYGNPNSMWSLYQYCTFALKESHPSMHMQKHIEAHKFFQEASKIITTPFKPLIIEPESPFKQLSWIDELIETEY